MNVLRAIKVAELRKKLAAIPGKLILALLLLAGIFVYSSHTFDLAKLWEELKATWIYWCVFYVLMYGAVSYFTFFMQLLKQWFLGLVASGAIIAALYFTLGKYDDYIFVNVLMGLAMIGPLFDIINFFRYVRLKNAVIEAEEELKQGINGHHDSAYDDGFEEGYRRGINAGKKDAEEDFEKRINSKKNSKKKSKKHEYIEESYDGDEWELEDDSESYDDSRYIDEDYYEEDSEDAGEESCGGSDEESYGGFGEDFSEEAGSESYEESGNGRTVYGDSSNIAGYFADCKNKREIKRRYHDLCKVYHPDSGNASSDIFCKLNAEYLELMSQYEDD